jgi:hypothetical protein
MRIHVCITCVLPRVAYTWLHVCIITAVTLLRASWLGYVCMLYGMYEWYGMESCRTACPYHGTSMPLRPLCPDSKVLAGRAYPGDRQNVAFCTNAPNNNKVKSTILLCGAGCVSVCLCVLPFISKGGPYSHTWYATLLKRRTKTHKDTDNFSVTVIHELVKHPNS